jgi:hypothetical protein
MTAQMEARKAREAWRTAQMEALTAREALLEAQADENAAEESVEMSAWLAQEAAKPTDNRVEWWRRQEAAYAGMLEELRAEKAKEEAAK